MLRLPNQDIERPLVTNMYTTKQIFDACNECFGSEPVFPYEEIWTPYGKVCEVTMHGVRLVFLTDSDDKVMKNWFRVPTDETHDSILDASRIAHMGTSPLREVHNWPFAPIETIFRWALQIDMSQLVGRVGIMIQSWNIIPAETFDVSSFGGFRIKAPVGPPGLEMSPEEAFYFENEADAVHVQLEK